MRAKELNEVFSRVFAALDQRILDHWSHSSPGGAEKPAHGFWRSGVIPKLVPAEAARGHGYWQAKSDLSELTGFVGMFAQMSISLQGGHSRIGIFLPNRLLDGGGYPIGESLAASASKAHDGCPASIVRRIGGDTLFDRIFTDAPFSAEWLLRCLTEDGATEILEKHLSWRVIDIWESALRVTFSQQVGNHLNLIIYSLRPLPASVPETFSLTLHETCEVQSGQWVSLASMPRSADLADVELRLQELFPDHRIRMQEDTVV